MSRSLAACRSALAPVAPTAKAPTAKAPTAKAPTAKAPTAKAPTALALLFAIAGALGPMPAAAQSEPRWRLVGETASMRLYQDPSSLVREDDVRRIRELQDLGAPDPDGVRSRAYVNEYDCRHQMHRLGQMQSYSGQMLAGERLFDVREMGYWRRIPAGSVFAQAYVRLCPDGQPIPAVEPPPPLQRLFGR